MVGVAVFITGYVKRMVGKIRAMCYIYRVTIGGANLKDIRITKSTRIDDELTSYVGISELKAIMIEPAGRKTILVVDADDSPAECPKCHKDGERFEYYPKEYVDCVVDKNGKYEYIILDHRFVKCLCRNHPPRLIKFSKEYDFAYRNCKVTKRMENRIVALAMRTSCYETEQMVDYSVSRQAIGTIVKRWVARCDSLRSTFLTPRNMAIISGTTGDKGYVFFADVAYGKFRIIDVIVGIDSANIISELRRFEIEKIGMVITDSNTILVDTLRSYLSDATVLSVDVDSLIPPVTENISRYMKKYARQIDTKVKGNILVARDNLSEVNRGRVDEALASRDELRKIYEHVNLLRKVIKTEHFTDYSEFEKWNETIPEDTTGVFNDVSIYIDDYVNEIINFYKRRNIVSGDIFIRIRALVDRLSRWSDRAPELMRARLLYASMVDDYEDLADIQWQGISYDDVMANIDMLIKEGGSDNER